MNLSKFLGPFSSATYRQRRLQLMKSLARNSESFVAVFWSGSEAIRNTNNHHPFRAHSDFLYLTGFPEMETLLLLKYQKGKFTSAMGLRPRDSSHNRGSEIWEGERLGVERAVKGLGVDEAFDIHHYPQILRSELSKVEDVFWNWGIFPEWDTKIIEMLGEQTGPRRGLPQVRRLMDSRYVLHSMRNKKSEEEVEIMRRSATISAQGHIRGMATVRPGQFEYQLGAEIEREFKRLGAQSLAYGSIVAAGSNACTLHYRSNSKKIEKSDLILIDAAGELDGYASDITRCYPASGKFTKEQRAVYEVVLEAQVAAVNAVRAGVPFNKPHLTAAKIISQGLKDLGIIKNQSAQNIYKKGLWRKFFMHGTSHWLGLDVHDCGPYFQNEETKTYVELPAGAVITIEPGLYFRADDHSVPARFRGIGVRIEDDVHVTRKGPDVLSAACPKTIEQVEAHCGPKL